MIIYILVGLIIVLGIVYIALRKKGVKAPSITESTTQAPTETPVETPTPEEPITPEAPSTPEQPTSQF